MGNGCGVEPFQDEAAASKTFQNYRLDMLSHPVHRLLRGLPEPQLPFRDVLIS